MATAKTPIAKSLSELWLEQRNSRSIHNFYEARKRLNARVAHVKVNRRRFSRQIAAEIAAARKRKLEGAK